MPSDPAALPITPYLLYEDLEVAITWLSDAFGCTEVHRQTDARGIPVHAELMHSNGGAVMVGCPGQDYLNPYSKNKDIHHSRRTLMVDVLELPLNCPF